MGRSAGRTRSASATARLSPARPATGSGRHRWAWGRYGCAWANRRRSASGRRVGRPSRDDPRPGPGPGLWHTSLSCPPACRPHPDSAGRILPGRPSWAAPPPRPDTATSWLRPRPGLRRGPGGSRCRDRRADRRPTGRTIPTPRRIGRPERPGPRRVPARHRPMNCRTPGRAHDGADSYRVGGRPHGTNARPVRRPGCGRARGLPVVTGRDIGGRTVDRSRITGNRPRCRPPAHPWAASRPCRRTGR